jgi:hypothetical protein
MKHLDAYLKNANGLKTDKSLHTSASKINLNGNKTFYPCCKVLHVIEKKSDNQFLNKLINLERNKEFVAKII